MPHSLEIKGSDLSERQHPPSSSDLQVLSMNAFLVCRPSCSPKGHVCIYHDDGVLRRCCSQNVCVNCFPAELHGCLLVNTRVPLLVGRETIPGRFWRWGGECAGLAALAVLMKSNLLRDKFEQFSAQ